MVRLVKGVGWLLLTLAAICVLFIPLVALTDKDDGKTGSAIAGFIALAVIFGLPGGLLLWRGRQLGVRQELADYIRVYDRFTAEELAKKIGATEAKTDKWILDIAREERLDLVFHRADRSYMHRNRIAAQSARVFDACPACGARLPHEVALEGERATCVYCGTVL